MPEAPRPTPSLTPALTPAREAERAARDKRLAEALRANLRRRKEQSRAREDRVGDAAHDPEAAKE
ncbi:MAG TPA: hypothetical protein VM782_08505 [Stellaceae bacterium]|nr:hypothetical protein [Stellaceae bacterium]